MCVPTDHRRPSSGVIVSHPQDLSDKSFRHLRSLCLAVLCERLAAFVLIATAAQMFSVRLGFPPSDSLRLYGLFSAACYFGSIPGGYLLDRAAHKSRGLAVSLLLLLLGYVALSLPYRASALLGLTLLVLGHAIYKPSTQRTLAAIIPPSDSQLESAQVLLHFAINLGAAAGSFLAGISVRFAGWSIAYAGAALAVGVGITFLQTSASNDSAATLQSKEPIPMDDSVPNNGSLATIGSLTLAMFLFSLVTAQLEGALLLWADKHTERFLLGVEIPVAWLITFAAILVLLFSPVQLLLLPRLRRSVRTCRLVACGLICCAFCFATLLPTAQTMGRTSIFWPLLSVVCFVLAEMLIAPLGLALLHRSTPKPFLGLVTGIWYGAGALGFFVGGEVGTLWFAWPIQRVLLLLTLLPLAGATVLWFPKQR